MSRSWWVGQLSTFVITMTNMYTKQDDKLVEVIKQPDIVVEQTLAELIPASLIDYVAGLDDDDD